MGRCLIYIRGVRYDQPACDYAKENLPHRYVCNPHRKHPSECSECPAFDKLKEVSITPQRYFSKKFLEIEL